MNAWDDDWPVTIYRCGNCGGVVGLQPESCANCGIPLVGVEVEPHIQTGREMRRDER
jgi:hypothetical protein